MTILQQLIRARVADATALTISTATERIAEEMARAILKDPAFRRQLQTLIGQAFTDTLSTLTKNGKRRRGKKGRRT